MPRNRSTRSTTDSADSQRDDGAQKSGRHYAGLGFSAEEIALLLGLDESAAESEEFVRQVRVWRLEKECELRERLDEDSKEGKISATRLLLILGGWLPAAPAKTSGGPRWDRFLLHEAPESDEEAGSESGSQTTGK
jgi:hypothetical protein